MNRQIRHQKAAEIRQAITAMRSELKTASTPRQAELFTDIDVAMDDYESFMDDGLWGMDEDHQPAQPLQPEVGMLEETVEDALEEPVGMGVEDFGGVEEAMGLYMDDGLVAGDAEVPMGALDDHTNVYADHNQQHVSYILDRVSEVVSAIEGYEVAAKQAKKASRSSGARTAIAAHMKALASVVATADFSDETTGDALSAVGSKVMEMHASVKAVNASAVAA